MNFKIIKISICILLATLISTENQKSACWAQDNETELFLITQKAFNDGFYDVTTRYINQLLSQYPQTEKRPQITILLGQCYFFKGEYLKAFNEFKKLRNIPGYQDAVLFWLGETYLKVKDYIEAKNNYEELLNLYSTSTYAPQAQYALAWIDFDQNQYVEAKQKFLNFLNLFPTHQLFEDSLFRIGECDFNLENYNNAIITFEKYTKTFPKSTRTDQALFYIAESNYYLKKYLTAIKYYEKSKEKTNQNQTKLIAEVGTGWSYLKLKEFDQAEQSFNEAALFAEQKNIQSETPLLGLANLFSEKGDFEKALLNYKKIIDLNPGVTQLADAYLGMANILYKSEDYENAIDIYQKIIKLFSADPTLSQFVEKAYLGLAWTYLKKGNSSDAIKNFEYVINHAENKIIKVSALTQIGDAYQDIGQYDQAIAAYDKILRNFSDTLYTDYAQYRQGIALLKMDKIDSATLSFQSLQKNFPNSNYLIDIKYYLGVAYFKKGDWAASKEKMAEFIAELSDDNQFQPDAHYILGLAYLNLKEYTEAIKIFKKIKKYYSANESLVQDSEINIARCLYEMGSVKDALKEFKIIIYKYPETKTALQATSWLAEYYLQEGDQDKSIAYYSDIIKNFPGNEKIGEALLGLSQSYYAKGEFDEALNQLKSIDNSFDEKIYGKSRLLIAEIFAKQIDTDTAIQTYQDIIKNSPEFARDAYVKIAEISKQKRRYAQSLEAYQKALDSPDGLNQTEKSEIQFLIGDVYESLNQPNNAIDAYLKIPYLYPKKTKWVIKSYLRVARLFEDKEDWDNAVSIYQKVIAYEVDERTFAQERLDWIKTNISLTNH
ncbi:MAG: tetratricopeptide repeat protein [Candidatus Omnitrophica bacterium]|nr:tetratricopeptide repeat protein [Candidatus Omnitrophota bacterium]